MSPFNAYVDAHQNEWVPATIGDERGDLKITPASINIVRTKAGKSVIIQALENAGLWNPES